MIQKRLRELREKMKQAGIDCYLIPTSDDHDSEYVSSFFRVREFFSGFTGSAGTLIVTAMEAALFTDGRYFTQATSELSGSGIQLMKSGEPGVPTIPAYLADCLQMGQTLAFDGTVVCADEAEAYEKIVEEKKGHIVWKHDPADGIWLERPSLCFQPVQVLPEIYSGECTVKKLKRVREKMKKKGATAHILTTLDDIAWLFNIRGNDVEYCPVVLAFAIITAKEAILFTGSENRQTGIGEEVSAYLKENDIQLMPYESFYEAVSQMHHEKVLLCTGRVSYRICRQIQPDVEIIDGPNPTSVMKAVKNPVEMDNLRKAHIKDAIAVTRFMYWLKHNVGEIPITEVSAAQYLEELRALQPGFMEPSFETICAYGANGAIVHYCASESACAEMKSEGLLVVDSGGHYLEGTTDITRTFVLGEISEEMRKHFTLVLRAMLNLKTTKFLYGCRGVNLDIRAREVFWEQGLDYKHGTGHGVGYLLNVHEGPNSFRWKLLPDYQDNAVLEEGMVTTDEPGIYIEGSHGIRIENELLCRKGEQNEYGQFMYFEDLTYVPIDLDGIEPAMLTAEDIRRLNHYHAEVYEKLSPFFEGEALNWLKMVTKEIER